MNITIDFEPDTSKINIKILNQTIEDATSDAEWQSFVIQGWGEKTYLKNYKERIGFDEELECTLVPPKSHWIA